MFEGLFRKKEPAFWLTPIPNSTCVLILPDKMTQNTLRNQVFNLDERRKLIKLFRENGIVFTDSGYGVDGDSNEPVFLASSVNMGEKFYSNANDLNEIPGDVREFEFFIKQRKS